MKLTTLFLTAALLSPSLAIAAENAANVSLADVDKQLQSLDTAIEKAAPGLSTQKVQGLKAQEDTLARRVEKVKSGGTVTVAERDSLMAAIETQKKQLQAALPKPRTIDSAAVPNSTVGIVAGSGSTTTIAPNGSVVMSNGPVVNGIPQGDTVVQPAFTQPATR